MINGINPSIGGADVEDGEGGALGKFSDSFAVHGDRMIRADWAVVDMLQPLGTELKEDHLV